jgi:hypothetical protein
MTALSDDFIQSVLSKLTTPVRSAVSVQRFGPLHEAASVLSSFDVHKLKPAGDPQADETVDELLAHSVQVKSDTDARLWSLSDTARVAVLRQLKETGRTSVALAANPEKFDSQLQRALESYLSGNAKSIDQQTIDELAAASRVSEWLRAAGYSNLPDRDTINRRIEWLTLLEPFEVLAGVHFRGRKAELATLREYAGVINPGVVSKVLRSAKNVFSFKDKPPMMIHGPGGVGKSALVARFILEHAQAHEADRFPFVYLDFDRTDIAASEPLTLLIEAVRQIGIEYPQARERAESIRQGWLNQFRTVKPGAGISPAQLASAMADFAAMIASLELRTRPVVFVVDTFEEVQYRSREQAEAVWRLLEQLQALIPTLRSIIVGRAPIEGRETGEMNLAGLDEEAAIGFLEGQGVTDPALGRALARQFGGSPLSLKLAAELAAREGTVQDGVAGIDTRQFLFMRLDDSVIQRQLYKRILKHIHNADVKKLAHPGLILRRITADIILKVLAEPCGLSITTIEQANDLFNELAREVALVSSASDGALVHRVDLRRLMLDLIRSDDPPTANTIQQRAVAYYEQQLVTPVYRAEEIYHRLWLNHDRATLESRWLQGVEPLLASALPEFTGTRRAYLASKIGAEIDRATLDLADLEDWETITSRKVHDLLNQSQPDKALELLRARTARSSRSPLFALEATALASIGMRQESLDVLQSGVSQSIQAHERELTVALVLQAAEVAIAMGGGDPTVEGELRTLLEGTLSPTDRIGTIARLLLLGPPSEELTTQLLELFDALSDDQLTANPKLACWAVVVFRQTDLPRISRAIRLCGLPRASQPALRYLAAQITAFDVTVSTSHSEPPGALARELKIPPRDTVTATWAEFILGAPDERLRDVLRWLLQQSLPTGVVRAFATVMRAALGIEIETQYGSAEEKRSARSSESFRERLARWIEMHFPTYELLAEFVFSRFDRALDAITPVRTIYYSATLLIDTADREGWLLQLVSALRAQFPLDLELAQIASQLGLTNVLSAGAPSEANREKLAAMEARVCRVEAAGRFTTGFLVGVDLVLTIDSVLQELYDSHIHAADVRLRFDQTGTIFNLAQDWNVVRSTDLHYALIRANYSPGAQPVGGGKSTVVRGWIELPETPSPIAPESDIIILQYAEKGPELLPTPTRAIRGDIGNIVYYDAPTVPGSAGAPCFNSDIDLIAMHLGRDRNETYGVTIDAILKDLKSIGMRDILRTHFA